MLTLLCDSRGLNSVKMSTNGVKRTMATQLEATEF